MGWAMLPIGLNNDINKLFILKHLLNPTIYNLDNQKIMTRIRNFSHTLPFILFFYSSSGR